MDPVLRARLCGLLPRDVERLEVDEDLSPAELARVIAFEVAFRWLDPAPDGPARLR